MLHAIRLFCASVGANSGIVRRIVSLLCMSTIFSFSRREFRNREAGICAFQRSPATEASVGANSGIVRREQVEPVAANAAWLQSARIQES